jgi:hypothetical protein
MILIQHDFELWRGLRRRSRPHWTTEDRGVTDIWMLVRVCGGRQWETRWIEVIVSALQPLLPWVAVADPMSPNA